MRRLTLIFCLFCLVLGSVMVATVAADWPFWQRAWRWHAAPSGWPESLPGAWRGLSRGAGAPWPESYPTSPALDAALSGLMQRWTTQALIVARDGRIQAERYGAGVDAGSLLQGRSATAVVLVPLYGVARAQGEADLLDRPLRQWIGEWQSDSRGDITPRQLFWELSGLQSPHWQPLNPFSDRARLSAGPNFERAALGFRALFPPGSHYEPSPANAQLLAMVLQRARGQPIADQLERDLWSPLGAGRATLMLDRLGGEAALHCCLATSGRDWLRLMMLVADDGLVEGRRLLPAGFVQELGRTPAVHPGRGMGFNLSHTDAGEVLLWLQSAGRLMIALPSRHLAAIWFAAGGGLPAEARAALLSALDVRTVNETILPDGGSELEIPDQAVPRP